MLELLTNGIDDRQRCEDVEKSLHPQTSHNPVSPTTGGEEEEETPLGPAGNRVTTWLKSFEQTLLRCNIEARGIQRVPPEDRHDLSRHGVTQILLIWISINLEAVVIALGFLGPVVYYLPFLDSCLLAVFGSILGAAPAAYIATFGPRSGNRTMILTRFITGWYPSKLIVVLTLIILMGYILIDAVLGGQILSAVADGNLSVIVGIVIVCVITWLVSTFGYTLFHQYERYAWLPQLIVISILVGVAGPKFDLYGNPSAGLSRNVIAGNRLSFFSLCLASQITYAEVAADFFVYYPVHTSRTKVFISTLAGLTLSSTFAFVVGVGLGSGTFTNPEWAAAYEVSQGALLVEAFKPLGSFGSFCSVVLALSLVGNMVPPSYASGIDFQALGRVWERIPRLFWNSVALVIPMICAIAGRAHLAEIFTNFLALMGYVHDSSVLMMHFWQQSRAFFFLALTNFCASGIGFPSGSLLFSRNISSFENGWVGAGNGRIVSPTTDKSSSPTLANPGIFLGNDRTKLPLGIAALIAFLVGWAGSILCMAQVWYVGPLAALISEYGGDMGNYVGFAWAGLVFPPLRWLEWRRFGR